MKRVNVTGLLFGLALSLLCASPAFSDGFVFDAEHVKDGLKDHGVDWLKDQAKDAGKEWVFGTGQSATMEAILAAAKNAANGPGNAVNGNCQGCVYGIASTVLENINYRTNVQNGARTMFDAMTKVAGLAAGGLGAAAEGGGLAWLGRQYADAAAGHASDAAMDALRKAFGDGEVPEFELFEDSGNTSIISDDCTYNLVAYWDIVAGTYTVLISGDCHCNLKGSGASGTARIGTYWISFSGSMRMNVNPDGQTVTFSPLTPRVDFDVQCNCNRGKRLKPTWTSHNKVAVPSNTGKTTTGGGTGATTGGTTGGGTDTPPPPPPPPPPLPKRGRTVCKECTDIQKQIDADWDAMDAADSEFNDAVNEYNSAKNNLGSDTGKLEDFKKSPSSFDTTEGKINEQISADKAAMDAANNKGLKAQATQRRLRKELGALGVQLDKCIAKCGHASSHHNHSNALIKFGLEKALDKHHKTDNQDEEDRRREEEQQNVKHDDDPYH